MIVLSLHISAVLLLKYHGNIFETQIQSHTLAIFTWKPVGSPWASNEDTGEKLKYHITPLHKFILGQSCSDMVHE